MVFCFVLPSCYKNDQSATLRENITPAARSDYSISTVSQDAINWQRSDPQKRRWAKMEDSGSMLRLLDSSTIALIEKVGPEDPIALNEILAYQYGEREVSHRLIRIERNGDLIFKGDSNESEDPPVKRSDVKWRIIGILYTNGK